jgi:hypothetical protein
MEKQGQELPDDLWWLCASKNTIAVRREADIDFEAPDRNYLSEAIAKVNIRGKTNAEIN